MSQSLSSILIHLIFSTKMRQPIIQDEIASNLYRYIISIAQSYESTILEIGGVEDHIHFLTTLPRTLPLSKLVEEIKKGSSKWIKTQGVFYQNFSWQNGYGAFSIGQSTVEAVRFYIQNQKEHHKKTSFQDEYRAFLKKYNIAFDEKYVWD
jgi:REP element-mobilizing transposase RayT